LDFGVDDKLAIWLGAIYVVIVFVVVFGFVKILERGDFGDDAAFVHS
jgi:hypothetical protein